VGRSCHVELISGRVGADAHVSVGENANVAAGVGTEGEEPILHVVQVDVLGAGAPEAELDTVASTRPRGAVGDSYAAVVVVEVQEVAGVIRADAHTAVVRDAHLLLEREAHGRNARGGVEQQVAAGRRRARTAGSDFRGDRPIGRGPR